MFDKAIDICGKHAIYSKFLCPTQNDRGSKKSMSAVFETIYEIFTTAVVVGLVQGLRAEQDKTSNDSTSIFVDKVIKEKRDLEQLLRLVVIIDNSRKLSSEQKIEYAFKNKNDSENLDLMYSYARGGIEWLYEK
ncbi:MAG: hypothetical protein FWF58_05210, partial [Firmicutes bacterium]|nr:hypothetical protein [Bacillota bacterium]